MTSVFAKRSSVDVPKGGTLSLSCVVQHCGDDGWTGGWGLSTEGQFLLFSPTPRHHLSKVTLTTNSTRLLMNILNVNQSDHGLYQCQITWVEGSTSVGHMTYVNITAGTYGPSSQHYLRVNQFHAKNVQYVLLCKISPQNENQSQKILTRHSQMTGRLVCMCSDFIDVLYLFCAAIPPTSVRKVYSRVAVYVSTCLVITLVLGLAYHIRSKVPSQPPQITPPKPPPRSQSARKDTPRKTSFSLSIQFQNILLQCLDMHISTTALYMNMRSICTVDRVYSLFKGQV